MTGDLFIVDGMEVINRISSLHRLNLQAWEGKCSGILDSFSTKTSTVATNQSKDNFREYTYWYQKSPDGSLESYGKERPDIESMYPPKPKHPIQFEYQAIDHRHIIISKDDYENNCELFGLDCFLFPYSALISFTPPRGESVHD